MSPVSPLITTEELDRCLEDAVVCDVRWDLVDPDKGRSQYESGHIPGAVFVDLDRDLASAPGIDGRHPLPDLNDFASTLGRLGISPNSHVVVYDDNSGRIAARMWWMLRSIGHEQVQVLDGAFATWVGEGRETEPGSAANQPATYPTPDRWTGVVTHQHLADRVLIDARAPERYRGDIEPVDDVAGHIPGAVNVPTDHNVDKDGRFRSPESLEEVYATFPHDVVVSCGSGVTACHDALALVIAGRPMPDVYVGSYSEWTRRGHSVDTGDDR